MSDISVDEMRRWPIRLGQHFEVEIPDCFTGGSRAGFIFWEEIPNIKPSQSFLKVSDILRIDWLMLSNLSFSRTWVNRQFPWPGS